MNADDLIVLSPADGRPSAICATEWDSATPDPYDCRAKYDQAGKPFRVFRYTHPGGPETHAYLVVPASLPDTELQPGGRYHGGRRAGPLRAVPVATLVRSRRSRLVIPGATAEEHQEVLGQLIAPIAEPDDTADPPVDEPDDTADSSEADPSEDAKPPKLKRGGGR